MRCGLSNTNSSKATAIFFTDDYLLLVNLMKMATLSRSWSVIADVTAEKQAEAQLLRAQRLDAVGQLTSGVAHDFNNLLTAIIGNLDMLESGVSSDPRWKRFLTAAQDAAARGARLTSQLLAFSRKQRMAPEPADLNQIIDNMGPLLQSTMGAAIRITTVLAGGLWQALVDISQIELVLLNLVINARDATPLAGLITIETANVTLDSRDTMGRAARGRLCDAGRLRFGYGYRAGGS